jgi:hypothetical protein
VNLAIFIAAVLHVVAFIWYGLLPIDHSQRPTGNFIADNFLIPVGSITLVCLVIFGIMQFLVHPTT